ncbi:hypothetical protein ACQWE9_24645, partial [Salmonella enterica subsp. enterica serovar Infantis]
QTTPGKNHKIPQIKSKSTLKLISQKKKKLQEKKPKPKEPKPNIRNKNFKKYRGRHNRKQSNTQTPE